MNKKMRVQENFILALSSLVFFRKLLFLGCSLEKIIVLI